VNGVDLAVTGTLAVLVAGSLAVFVWRVVRDWRGAGRSDDED
jgi:hypothetical protein